jgi:hypothetical protein
MCVVPLRQKVPGKVEVRRCNEREGEKEEGAMDMTKKVALITGMGMDAKTLTHLLLSKNYTVILTYRRNTNLDISKVLSLYTSDLLKYPNSKLDTIFMDIFEYINNILFHKKSYKEENFENNKVYNIFLINRWLSMFNDDCSKIVNETTNRKNFLANDKDMHYKMLLNIVPKNKFKKFTYIKKPN